MKSFSLLILAGIAFILFGVGLSIPGTLNPFHIAFIMSGLIGGIAFYLLSFQKVFKDESLTKGRRMLWTISIICLPMIGNTFYVIVNMMSSIPQTIKSQS